MELSLLFCLVSRMIVLTVATVLATYVMNLIFSASVGFTVLSCIIRLVIGVMVLVARGE